MRVHRWLGLFAVAVLISVGGAPAIAESDAPGVTDFSGANVSVIEVIDITTALAVPRGTRIEASAPPTVRLPIFFEFNSATLRPDGQALLDKVGAALASNELDTFRFSIEGHTDSVGSESYNTALSTQRAESVKIYLLAQGVPADRLDTIGRGESVPVADNQSDEGRRRNRRVELINLGSIE